MDIERDLLAIGRPVLITKTVREFAVSFGLEAVIAGGDCALVDEVGIGGVLDLQIQVNQ